VLLACLAVFATNGDAAIPRQDDKTLAAVPAQSKLVLINFWATWCEPCVEEIPALVEIHKKWPDLKMVGVSMDEVENEKLVQDFIKKHGILYEVVLRQGDQFESLVNAMDPDWIGGLPATFVFKDGKRIFSKQGAITQEEILRLR
jgi:thiol-disulfide isomerase/thioredoxin